MYNLTCSDVVALPDIFHLFEGKNARYFSHGEAAKIVVTNRTS